MATTAIRFDASGDRLRISSGLWDYNAAYTFCAWVYVAVDRGVDYQSIFCRYGSGSAMDQVHINGSGAIASFIANSADTVVSGATLSTGTWYYVAIVRESNASIKVYLDGSSTPTITNTRSVSGRTDTTPLFDISTNAYTEWYNGRMAFARLWTVALSNAEINAEMDSLTAVKTASLWADWPLQADDDDDTANARHFTTAGTVTYSEAGPDIAAGGTTYNQSAAGTLTPAGATSKRTAKRPAGTLTTAGALAKRARKTLAGTLTTAGALTRRAAKALVGTLTSAGTLATIRLYIKAVGGTLTTAGALARRANKVAGGTLTTAGALSRRTNKVIAGTLTTAGALTRRAAKAINGALTTAGSLATSYIPGSVTFSQAVGGTLTTAGALARRTNKAVGGTLTTAGAIVRRTAKALAGALTSAGSLATSFVSGSVTFSQAVGGTLTTAGALARRTDKALAGTLTAAGALARRTAKTFAGTLTTAGGVLRNLFSPSAAKLDVTLADARVNTCSLTDARVHTCSLTDALTYRVTLGDATV